MTISNHMLAGFSHGFRHRWALAALLDSTPVDNCILRMELSELVDSGISVIAVDFDGVLAPHGLATPLAEAHEWLEHCTSVFGGENIFILSNKPTNVRGKWFGEHFPHARFISGVRKKPFPDGLEKVAAISGVETSSIIMIDDRLLTGCLAAINAGARSCYISKPYISLSHNTVSELSFMIVRILERLFVHLCCIWK